MADNYLEKRMEDYRAGRPARTLHTSRKTVASVTFPAERVAMIGVGDALSVEALSRLVHSGCKVAFTVASGTESEGAMIAQRTGGRFYPCTAAGMFELLTAEGDAPSVLVLTPGDYEVALPEGVRCFALGFERAGAVSVVGRNQADLARMLVCLIAAPELPSQVIMCD